MKCPCKYQGQSMPPRADKMSYVCFKERPNRWKNQNLHKQRMKHLFVILPKKHLPMGISVIKALWINIFYFSNVLTWAEIELDSTAIQLASTMKNTVSLSLLSHTSAASREGKVCVTASDLFILNGIVWITAATIQKAFLALWSPGKSTKAVFFRTITACCGLTLGFVRDNVQPTEYFLLKSCWEPCNNLAGRKRKGCALFLLLKQEAKTEDWFFSILYQKHVSFNSLKIMFKPQAEFPWRKQLEKLFKAWTCLYFGFQVYLSNIYCT